MATIVLGAAGRLIGGPVGSIIGTTLGSVIDASLLRGTGRRGGRQSNLAVQSAAYGEPIAVVTGRMRVAGNLLWSSGITESTAGGGKGGSSYSYSASFAVGLVGREIAGVGRIWADGKLIRDANGTFVNPVTMRLHLGDESQAPDPLILASEGAAGAPGYRGIAYAVFEDLPLADYGNRIPNLTFEVIADAGAGHDAGAAIAALGQLEGRAALVAEGEFPALSGHFAGQSGSLSEALAPLLALSGAAIVPGQPITVRGGGGAARPLPGGDVQARPPGIDRRRDRRRLLGGEQRNGAVEVSYYDVTRDYQPGVQRVRRDAGAPVDQRAFASAMSPEASKALAAGLLARSEASRWQLAVRLPWRHVAVRAGEKVTLADQPGIWRVRQARFEAFVVHLDLEREPGEIAAATVSDGGRIALFSDLPVGTTTLAVLDLPALPGDPLATPRLWLAAASTSEGWRRAPVEVSADNGESYAALATIKAPTPMGQAATALGEGPANLWDDHNSFEVELLAEMLWLESRSPASVLAGANLALVGAEIVQFRSAEMLAPRRFRLSGLLRGRLGTEAAIAGHQAGERFILLDQTTMLPFDLPTDAIGRTFRFRAAGAGDGNFAPIDLQVTGRGLQPLSPVQLSLTSDGLDVTARWTRRSRQGFGWPDFVDAPLAETSEAYRIEIRLDGRLARIETVNLPSFTYTLADRLADGDGRVVAIAVAQLSAVVGPGGVAEAAIDLAAEREML